MKASPSLTIPRVRKAIKIVEELPICPRCQATLNDVCLCGKIDLLLLLANEKPATEYFLLAYRYDRRRDVNAFPFDFLAKFEVEIKKLQKMGIYCWIDRYGLGEPSPDELNELVAFPSKHCFTQHFQLFAANSARDLDTLKRMTTQRKKNHHSLGELYGIPKTARNAFTKDAGAGGLDLFEIPWQSYLTRDEFLLMYGTTFSLSPKHWQDEMLLVKRWAKIITQMSSQIARQKIDATEKLFRRKS